MSINVLVAMYWDAWGSMRVFGQVGVEMLQQKMLQRAMFGVSLALSMSTAWSASESEAGAEAISLPKDGYEWGGFLVRPQLRLGTLYDSNIFATRSDEVADYIALINPSLAVSSDWAQHRIKLTAGGEVGRYYDFVDEDYEDYWLDLEGRYDFSKQTNVFGGLGYSFEHEDRGSPETILAGATPTTYASSRAQGGISHYFGPWSVRLGATFEQLDFDDVVGLTNDDRDRDVYGLGVKLGYQLDSGTTVYVQAIQDIREYDQILDDNGYNRDSEGIRLGAGVKGRLSSRIKAEGYLGHLGQSYEDAAFDDVDALDFLAKLNWRYTPSVELGLVIERLLEETTLPGSSSYLYTSAGLFAKKRISPRLLATASVEGGLAEYQDVTREDMLYSGSLGLRYLLTPTLFLEGRYNVQSRDSNQLATVNTPANPQDSGDYVKHQVFLSLGALMYPVRSLPSLTAANPDRLATQQVGWGGFYAGAAGLAGSTNIRTTGQRGGSGSDLGDFGNDSVGASVFAGWGIDLDRWYLGVEVSADEDGVSIYHNKDKTQSRTFSIERGRSYAAALRGGYHLATGSLFYGRLGWVNTDFNTFYAINDEPENAVNQAFSQDGIRLGMGADIPLDKHLFTRLDYSYTDYENYDVDVVTDVDNFDPSDSRFALGIGWHLDPITRKTLVNSAASAKGFYAGGHVGHGSANSFLNGVHNDSAGGGVGTITSDFVGDFGYGNGYTGGLFAGYGVMWRAFYIGLEAEAEASSGGWDHIRYPRGRNFSVDKHDTYGVSIRGGYQVRNGALLYVKAGRVRTRFNTTWVKGNNRNNDVDRDDEVYGQRLGLGAEMPVSKSSFLRMEYSFTDYDSYSFVTSHANFDTMTFSNSETLFRLGLGIRF